MVFLLTVDDLFSFLATIGASLLTGFFSYSWSFLAYSFSFLLTVGVFAYSGKVRVIRALRDCKQRSSTVS